MLCYPAAAVPPGRVCAASRAAPTGAGRGPPPLASGAACPLASVCAPGERRQGQQGRCMRAEGPRSWVPLCPHFLPSLSAPQCREPRRAQRVPPRDFLRGGSGGPEAVHGGRQTRGCPSHSKGGRRWATRPSTSTRGRRTTSRSSLAPYAATWWTHHCSPPATTSSALRACKTGWTACRNAQRAPPSSTRGMAPVRCSRVRRSPGELPLHTSH